MNSIRKLFLSLSAIAALLGAIGCGKKADPAGTVGSADTNVGTAAVVVVSHAPVMNPIVVPQAAAGDTSQILAALTQALRKYAVEHKGMPRDFSEIVSAGYVRDLPAPPPGKRFVIDAQTARVMLVNQ